PDSDVIHTANIAPDGTIYSAGTQRLHALNPDGSLKWVVVANGAIFTSSPAIAPDGTIYFGTVTGTLFAINPDGTVRWTNEAGRHIKYAAPSVADDGTIYTTSGSQVLAFLADGTPLWTYSTGARLLGALAMGADGTLYVPSNDHTLYAFGS